MSKRRLMYTASAAILTFGALPSFNLAVGQTPQPPPAAPQTGQQAPGEREVVVVTATRREADIQDAPINIAAVGGEAHVAKDFKRI